MGKLGGGGSVILVAVDVDKSVNQSQCFTYTATL